MVSRAQGASVVAVIPAYNEARFIGSVVLQARQYVDAVIVVDDGSTDATAEIAQVAGALVLRHEQNQGKGKALWTGLQAARRLNPQAVVLLDGDGEHLPPEIPLVLAPVLAGEADMVVGSRCLNGNSRVPRIRVWGHRFFNFLSNRTSGVHLTDSQNGFRAFSGRFWTFWISAPTVSPWNRKCNCWPDGMVGGSKKFR
ncbi:MAG: glycosyltransferase family 2 protein [Thermoflexia bacterium]|nr:MAG: glycosyltransferase family 2 protein [Thermoflexia bacterium]